MTTFEDLLKKATTEENIPLPTPLELISRNEEVIAYHQSGEETTVVYSSGLILFTRGDSQTVYHVKRCHYMAFGSTKIEQKEFLNLEWFHPVTQICNRRVDDNIQAEEQKKIAFYYDESDGAWSDELVDHSMEEMLDRLDKEEKVKRLLSVLTPKQRRIVELRYLEGMEPKEISSSLGISMACISQQLKAAIAHMKKESSSLL